MYLLNFIFRSKYLHTYIIYNLIFFTPSPTPSIARTERPSTTGSLTFWYTIAQSAFHGFVSIYIHFLFFLFSWLEII